MARRPKTFTTAPTPMAFWVTGFELARLGLEAQAVIGLRLMGMGGFWAMPTAEAARMVAEKQTAFVEAAMAAGRAMATGAAPDAALRKGLGPLRSKTSSNVTRLSRGALR